MNTEQPVVRYGISATYRCNQKCLHCNRYLREVEWPDSDVAVQDVVEAGAKIRAAGIIVNKVRITGGEPTLHPDLAGICKAVNETWRTERQTVVLTNHTLPLPDLTGTKARYSWGSDTPKNELHRPWTISPADLGLKPVVGYNGKACWVQRGCGRLFDRYGFGPCVLAGAMGRVLGIDPYESMPVLFGREEMCMHCICSLRRNKQWQLWGEASRGELDFPTKTYLDGLDALRKNNQAFMSYRERMA